MSFRKVASAGSPSHAPGRFGRRGVELLGAAVLLTLLRSQLAMTHAATLPGTVGDFDFLIGSWRIHNHYLKGRLRGSAEWVDFDARSQVEPLLNGLGNLDRYSAIRDGKALEGITLRLFNPATGKWSIYWADNVRPGELSPMVGSFEGDEGVFFGDEQVDGRKVLCRFRWLKNYQGSPRWEQAFSGDGGRSWETNWIMTFTPAGR
jgi:hypothetical protein